MSIPGGDLRPYQSNRLGNQPLGGYPHFRKHLPLVRVGGTTSAANHFPGLAASRACCRPADVSHSGRHPMLTLVIRPSKLSRNETCSMNIRNSSKRQLAEQPPNNGYRKLLKKLVWAVWIRPKHDQLAGKSEMAGHLWPS